MLSRENIQMLEESDTFGGAFTPRERRVSQGLFDLESSGSTSLCVMLMAQSGL